MTKIICCSLLIIVLAACGGDGGVSLSITSPSDGQSYTGGDDIIVSGTATDDIAISSVNIMSTDLQVNQNFQGNGTSSLQFELTISISESPLEEQEFSILIQAIDDELNSVEETRKITLKP